MSDAWWTVGLLGAMFAIFVLHAMYPEYRQNREYWARKNADDVDPRYWKPRSGYYRDKRHYRSKRNDESLPE